MDQAITSSHPVCSTLEPTACLAGNSDPAHLLSDPEKSNPTEGNICTFVMVTSSIHLILSNPTLLAKLKQMDVTFLKGNPPKIIPESTHIYSKQKSQVVLQCRAHPCSGHVPISSQAHKQGELCSHREQPCPADTAPECPSTSQSCISSPQHCHSHNL